MDKERVIKILFYDFEVFKYDWLVVVIDSDTHKEHVIINMKQINTTYGWGTIPATMINIS